MRKSSIAIILLLIVFPAALNALEIELTPAAGFRHGNLGEYVFLKESPYSSSKLSELVWNYDFAYASVKTGVRGERFCLENAVSFAFLSTKSSMSDSDWQNVQYSGLSSYQYKTNYSESDNVLCRAVSVNTKAAFAFKPLSWLDLSPFFAVDFDYMRFRAEDGWYEYGKSSSRYYYSYSDSEHNSTGYFSGTVMRYRRWDVLTWLGASADFHSAKGFRAAISAAFCPYFFTADIDEHTLRGIEFVDMADGILCAYKIAGEAECAVSARGSLGVCVQYTGVPVVKGVSYQKSSGSTNYAEDTVCNSGMSKHDLCTAVFFRIRLF